MRVRLCGVRGSTPAPGPEYVGVGGHTSCMVVAHDGAPWSLAIDAGTGLTTVTGLLDGEAFRGAILLGHLHLDHTQGLPFFQAADRPDASVALYVPAQDGLDATELLDRCYSPPHFPISVEQFVGEWSFHTIDTGTHVIAGFEVTAIDIPHGGGRTLGYRISDGRASIAYLSDHGPSSDDTLGPALALADGVDALFHDSHFTVDEQQHFAHFGHSTPQTGLDIAGRAGARRLVLVHHAPRRSDHDVQQMAIGVTRDAADLAASGGPTVEVVVGREGLELQLP